MEAQIATTSCPLLARFNAAGVLKPGDVHVATRVAAMVGEERPEARLMLALITKGLRDGSVCVDLATVPEGPHDPATRDWDIDPEAWPHAQWPTVLETSPLTTTNPAVVRLHNNRAYAHRYWDEETHVLNALVTRLETSDTSKDVSQVSATYFPDPTYADQARAARLATSRSLAIITGGPGSGKTTTLARILGMLLETTPDVRIGLGAPTG
ncbi:MAG TPA: AAA family ATPase, partial [Beutenbergiaceae bacterium]|nr:AAA family ATPase [Beutenbergiaceae bacterium]